MRYLPAVLVFLACSTVAGTPSAQAQQRDGVWLQNGLRQYLRLNAHETLTQKDANDAVVVTSYVCAVVDLEKYLVQRADLLAAAFEAGKKKKGHLDPRMLQGMTQALPMIIPLMKTPFFADSPPCDRAFLIVRDYLDQYPEVLDKDAQEIVEKALLNAYTRTGEP